MEIKIKRLHPDAVIPSYANETDAGLDLTAVTYSYDEKTESHSYGTGLAFEIPEGYVGLIFPRSSIYKKDTFLSNCVGVIDSGYRGEVSFKFKTLAPFFEEPNTYDVGDRIGQMIIMPYPKIQFVEVDELSQSDRGENGYGSTGR